MKNARILIVDSSKEHNIAVKLLLQHVGHEVILEVISLEQVDKIIHSMELQANGINLALVAGSLRPLSRVSPWDASETLYSDGEKVCKALKKSSPDIKVIAYTLFDDPTFGDARVCKRHSIKSLYEAISAL